MPGGDITKSNFVNFVNVLLLFLIFFYYTQMDKQYEPSLFKLRVEVDSLESQVNALKEENTNLKGESLNRISTK